MPAVVPTRFNAAPDMAQYRRQSGRDEDDADGEQQVRRAPRHLSTICPRDTAGSVFPVTPVRSRIMGAEDESLCPPVFLTGGLAPFIVLLGIVALPFTLILLLAYWALKRLGAFDG